MAICKDDISIMEKVLSAPQNFNFKVDTLGECRIKSPLQCCAYIDDKDRVLVTTDAARIRRYVADGVEPPTFEKAGPASKIFFDPAWTRVAIVTAGGLCPGLNDVIKGIVQILFYEYGVRSILGIRYGYGGLLPESSLPPLHLTPEMVDTIHEQGGSILGSSRGNGDRVVEIVDTLRREDINILFCVGGDGTLRGASDIAREIKKRNLSISVVGIPKTIDNDLNFVGKSFGFETAVYQTNQIITAAHNEAKGAFNGIGLVKLMGRDSGFIAAYAALANSVANFCLVPELKFELEGEHGLLKALERRFSISEHCVIVVAEGAGQHLMKGTKEVRDASGNLLKKDIGVFLKNEISRHFKEKGMRVPIKYFDPSYSIRSTAAQGTDAILCYLLAKNAVHAGMRGKTNCVIGNLNGVYSMVPIELATVERQQLDLKGDLWRAVMDVTQQNKYFGRAIYAE